MLCNFKAGTQGFKGEDIKTRRSHGSYNQRSVQEMSEKFDSKRNLRTITQWLSKKIPNYLFASSSDRVRRAVTSTVVEQGTIVWFLWETSLNRA